MRSLALLVSTLALFVACSSQQQVQKASTCSDRCCGGDPTRLDCGESGDVMCTESGDPCTAQVFGCTGGVFFMHAQTSPPASCGVDSGLDAMMGADVTSPGDASDAAPAADAPSEAMVDATGEAGPDATGGIDAAPDAALDAPDGS